MFVYVCRFVLYCFSKMKFRYSARTKDGELQVGYVEAANKDMAATVLSGHNLFILSVEDAQTKHWFDEIHKIFNRVTLTSLMIFTRQFATLLESKLPLGDSLKNLYKQTKSVALRDAIYEVSSDIDSGLSLSQALEKQSAIFSDFYVNMVRSAEVTGRLEEAISYLAIYLEKERMWRSRIINSLIYPVILLVSSFAVIFLMTLFVFPTIRPFFEESNVKLPWFTKMILGIGDFTLNWWPVIVIAIIAIIIGLVNYLRSREGKIVLDQIILRTPILGDLFKKIYVARFSESLSILIKGGVPVAQALEITSHSIGSYYYQDIIHDISQKVRGGTALSTSLNEREFYFPVLVGQMAGIGETTGRLDEMLEKVANFYSREVEDITNRLGELIQPLLIAFIGAFVGLLFASILIPIYNLIQSIQT